MKIFDFDDFRAFINWKIASLENKGRGQYKRIAEHLGVHTTLVSQIFRDIKMLSLEHALALSEYFGLNPTETEYLLLLVQKDRAGTQRLKLLFEKQASRLRAQAQKLENRLPYDTVLSEADKALYYSEWYFGAARILTSIPGFSTAETLSKALDIPISNVNRILEFLLARGLCIEDKKGKLAVGPKRTFLESDSNLIGRHHTNWRMRAIEHYPRMTTQDFAYTSPLSISERGFLKVREELRVLAERVAKIVSDDDVQENLVCFNIDWLSVAAKKNT